MQLCLLALLLSQVRLGVLFLYGGSVSFIYLALAGAGRRVVGGVCL